MLQIRLSKAPPADGPTAAATAADTVTVVCPDHLVLADLPVAKGIGAPIAASQLKAVGRRSRRQLGERVHFCVRCDFPISIYGRLSPCEHAFCLDCARSDSICYLCDERIQKIQTIKLMEGIFICAAPHCLKSFLKRSDFESHIHQSHSELLHPNYTDKEEHNNINMNMNNNNINDSEAQSAKQSSAAESTLRAPPLPPPPRPSDDKNRRQLAREPSLPRPPIAALPKPLGPGPFQQPGFEPPVVVVPKNEPPGSPFTEYPAFGYGSQAYYGAPYEMGRPEEAGSDHGSLLGGFPPPVNYPPQPWGAVGPAGGDGFGTNSIVPSPESSQGKIPFYGGEFGRSKPMEMRDGKGILAPPPPQQNRKFYSDMGRDPQGYGWQQDSRDGFGSSQD